MMKKTFVFLFLLVLFGGAFLFGAWYSQSAHIRMAQGDRKVLYYVDPMNPTNISENPGIAPCGMPMEPVYDDDGSSLPSGTGKTNNMLVTGGVRVDSNKQQLIGVRIETVGVRDEVNEIRTLGRVVPIENKVFPIISPTDGWISEISDVTQGSQVNKNQVMALINVYNYDFYTWQQKYLQELSQLGLRTTPSGPTTEPRGANPSTSPSPNASRLPNMRSPMESTQTPRVVSRLNQRNPDDPRIDFVYYPNRSELVLLNLGVSREQLNYIAQTGAYVTNIEIRSPAKGLVLNRNVLPGQKIDPGTECFRIVDLSRVWIVADLFERDIEDIRSGLQVKITLPQGGKTFSGKIGAIVPLYDGPSRTLKLRIEVENPGGVLRPDMFVDVTVQIPMHRKIFVPAGAVVQKGMQRIVYRSIGEGYFEPREIITGKYVGQQVEVVQGLSAGDHIVVSGNFLIDSESRMRSAAIGLMSPSEKERLKAVASDGKIGRTDGVRHD